jgi:hypothetical protein
VNATDERVADALRWTADNRPSRGADAVFAAACDEIVVTRLDYLPAPPRRRPGLVAVAVVVVGMLTVGVLVLLRGRPDAPTVGTDSTMTHGTTILVTSAPPGGPCRVGGACTMPERPVSMTVPVPPGYRRYEPAFPPTTWTVPKPVGLQGLDVRGDVLGPLGAKIEIGMQEQYPGFAPNTTIGGRPASVTPNTMPGRPELYYTGVAVALNDRLVLWARGEFVHPEELVPIIESVEIL